MADVVAIGVEEIVDPLHSVWGVRVDLEPNAVEPCELLLLPEDERLIIFVLRVGHGSP